jgi:hypothetical protein
MPEIYYQKYESMTQAYDILVSARTRIQEIKERIEKDFKPTDSSHFNNPLDYKHNLIDEVEQARINFTEFIISHVEDEDKFNNISLDSKAILDFVEQRGYFNHAEIIQFITEKYADVDSEALKQIKVIVRVYCLMVLSEKITHME